MTARASTAARRWRRASPRRWRAPRPSPSWPPPPQSVHPDIRDLEGLAASCARGRTLGLLGRAAMHPRQLPIIERACLPTAWEIEEAETVVKAATTRQGAQALPNGRFVDAAVVATAHRTLSPAGRRQAFL